MIQYIVSLLNEYILYLADVQAFVECCWVSRTKCALHTYIDRHQMELYIHSDAADVLTQGRESERQKKRERERQRTRVGVQIGCDWVICGWCDADDALGGWRKQIAYSKVRVGTMMIVLGIVMWSFNVSDWP